MTYPFASIVRATAADTDRRSIARDDVQLHASAYASDAQQYGLQIDNLSPHGLMARSDYRFFERERLRVLLPTIGPVAAEVRWTADGQFGVSFDTAIDLASYYELLAQLLKPR